MLLFTINAHEKVETMKLFIQSVSSNIAKIQSASALPSLYLIVLLLATIITLPLDASAEIRKEYYPSGKLKTVVNYVNGEKEGIYKEYYESGQLWIEENYKNDKKNGVYSEYSKTGELRFRDIYKNDKRIKTKNIHNI